MWLSNAIKKDAQIRLALRELERLAKKYQDATKLPGKSKFFSTEIRWFRPSVWWYILFVLGFGVVGVFQGLMLETPEAQAWLGWLLRIIVPIFVLAVTITSLARSFSESVKFAGEYFNEVCRMELYCCLTLVTILMTILSSVLADSKGISTVIIECFAGISLGATLSCITGIAFIIRETIRCAELSKAVEAATSYATRKLSYATLKKVYLSVWMGKYSDTLNEYLKDLKNIHIRLYSKSLLQKKEEESDKSGEYQIKLPKEIDFNLGYRDYNLKKLEKINELLESQKAKLYLAPHGFNSKEFGTLCYEEPCNEVYNKINKKLSSICRFGEDKHVEEEKSFWDEHYLKLHSALLRAIKDTNMAQFRKYLKSLESIHVFFRRARSNRLIRKYLKPDYEKYRYLRLYSKSVKWLLESTNKIEEDILELFLYALIESIKQQVEEDIKCGDWCILDALKWIIPDTYKLFHELVKDKKSRLWELRARIGSFYDFAGSFLSEYESNIKEEDKLQIQLVLHKGIISWLLIAIDNKDDELIKSLCEAAKRLVFQDNKITFRPQQLVTQHFILCGKMLEFLMDKKPHVSPDIFKLLCFDKYDHTSRTNIDYEKLVKFFIKSRKEYDLRSLLWEFSETDWNKNPLSGGGFGTPMATFSGAIEFDYMFIYLALLSMPLLPDIEPMPFDFSGYNLKGKIDKFEAIARNIDIYPSSKEKLNKWLDACDELYKKKKEERIAASQIEPEVCESYDKGFQGGLKESVPFVDYCVKKGYVQESDAASMKTNWHMPKEWFLGRSPNDIVREGTSHGKEIGHDANTWTIRSLIDYEEEEADVGKDVGMRLIQNNEAREKAAKEVQKAVEWLKGTGCSTDQGVIILRGVSPDVLYLFKDSEYKPAWREKGIERGFEGYYHGYRVLYLWDVRGRPLCAAIDLRGWCGLNGRPELVNENKAGKVLEIRERKDGEIQKAIKGDMDETQAKGYCVVEFELFWKMPEEKPKQKVFLYKLPPSESNN